MNNSRLGTRVVAQSTPLAMVVKEITDLAWLAVERAALAEDWQQLAARYPGKVTVVNGRLEVVRRHEVQQLRWSRIRRRRRGVESD
jgi:hypothetical protein